jgi:small redox-active disulfide protein 2
MKKIQVLGTGCPKCQMLMKNTESAVKELGIEAKLSKVTYIKEIMGFGIMSTPALTVDGKIVSSGKALKTDEIKKLIGS